MNGARIYEGTDGFIIDIEIVGLESFEDIANTKLYVLVPGSETEEIWEAEMVPGTKTMRSVLFQKPLVKGEYKIQPYFEINSFKGKWGTVSLHVNKKYT